MIASVPDLFILLLISLHSTQQSQSAHPFFFFFLHMKKTVSALGLVLIIK